MPISKTGYHTMFIAGFSKSTGRPSLLFVALTAVLNFGCVSNATAVASGFEDPVLPYPFHYHSSIFRHFDVFLFGWVSVSRCLKMFLSSYSYPIYSCNAAVMLRDLARCSLWFFRPGSWWMNRNESLTWPMGRQKKQRLIQRKRSFKGSLCLTCVWLKIGEF